MSILSFLGGLVGIGPTRRTITISKAATNAGLPFVIGEARLKAISVFTHISQQNGPLGTVTWDYEYDPRPSHGDEEVKGAREWLHRIDVFAQGPITSYERFYVDSDAHTSARFGTRPYFRTVGYFGSATQAAFNWGSVTSKRGSNHRGVGVAYAISRFYAHGKYPKYNSEPVVEAVLQGIALYDPRPAAAQTEGLESSYTFSENPSLGLLRYLTADTGADWGFVVLDVDSFKVAADLCDVAVTIPARLINDTGSTISWRNRRAGWFEDVNDGADLPTYRRDQIGTSQSRLKGSFILDPEAGIKDNIEALLTVMHGHLPFSNGKYKLIIEDTVSAVGMAFDDDSILGNWKVTDGGRKDRLNRATVTFINKNKSYKEDSVSWPALDSAIYTTLLAEDSGEKLHQTFDVPAISDYYQAEDWAEFQVRNSRANKRVTVDLAPKAMVLEFGDVISLTSTARDYTAKWFRVRKITLKVDGTVTADLVEYDGTIYSWSTKTVEPLDDPGEAPFVWDDPIALASLNTVAFHDINDDGTVVSGFNVSWDAPVDTAGLEHIEVAWKLVSDIEYDSIMRVLPENTMARIVGLADARAYTIRVTYRTSLGQISVIAVRSSQSLTASGSRVGFMEDYATNGDPYGMTENLLSVNAGPELTLTGTAYHLYISKVPIADLGRVVGDTLSCGIDMKTDGTAGEYIRFRFVARDIAGGFIEQVTGNGTVAITTYERITGTMTIPANTVSVSLDVIYGSGSTGTKYAKNAMLNRGPVALPYVKAVEDGSTNTDNEAVVLGGNNNLFANGQFALAAADGRPAGVRTLYGATDPAYIMFAPDGALRIASSADASTGVGFAAFKVNPKSTYRVTLEARCQDYGSGSGDAGSGFYLDVVGENAELASGIKFICSNSTFESSGDIVDGSGSTYALYNNVAITQSYAEFSGIWTPDSTDVWAAIMLLNWSGMGYRALDIRNVVITEIAPQNVYELDDNVFDSNFRFVDNERMPMLRNYGLGTSRTSNPLSASDAGATATISIATHTVYNGDATGLSFNAGSITGLAFSTGYTVYADDPTYAGGSVTYVAATAGVDAGKNLGRYLVGTITTPADGSPPATGGGGGGFDCIAVGMWLMDNLRAKDVKPSSTLMFLTEIEGIANGNTYYEDHLESVEFSNQPCVEIETTGGAKLICSLSTPVTLRSGALLPVTECLGGELATLIDGEFAWQEVIHIDHVGKWPVAHIHAGGRTFAAGSESRARIFTHNAVKP